MCKYSHEVYVLRIQGQNMNMTWVEHLICTDMTGNSAARRRTPTTVETGGFLTHVVDAPAATCGGEANFRGNSCFYFCAYKDLCYFYCTRTMCKVIRMYYSYKYKQCIVTHSVFIASKGSRSQVPNGEFETYSIGCIDGEFSPQNRCSEIDDDPRSSVKYSIFRARSKMVLLYSVQVCR